MPFLALIVAEVRAICQYGCHGNIAGHNRILTTAFVSIAIEFDGRVRVWKDCPSRLDLDPAALELGGECCLVRQLATIFDRGDRVVRQDVGDDLVNDLATTFTIFVVVVILATLYLGPLATLVYGAQYALRVQRMLASILEFSILSGIDVLRLGLAVPVRSPSSSSAPSRSAMRCGQRIIIWSEEGDTICMKATCV